MAQKLAMSDDRISAILLHGISVSVGFSESKLAKERERLTEFYFGERPYKAHPGDTGYQSMDVYEAVEMMKAQLLEVFSGNGRPVEFLPQHGEPPDASKMRTDYVTDVLFRQNPGFAILHDTIHDGLLYRAGIVKAWWEDKIEELAYDLTDTTKDEIIQYLMQNDARINEVELHEDGETIKRANVLLRKNRSQVRLKVLPPEEWLISPMAEDIETAELVTHRRLVTISDLLKMGFDRKVVMNLSDNDRIWLQTEPELLTRHRETDDLIGLKALESGQKARRTTMLYECYAQFDMKDDGDDAPNSGVSQLWKVMMVGDTILLKERVDRKPFIAFVPLPIPHKFWGHSYGKLLQPTQTASTYLTRSIINHALVTNNPRMAVVRGAVLNPRELMENRFGGVVNVTRPDGIFPLPQAGLNPFVYQTVGLLSQKREGLTGISAVSQGLDKDAISKQNSGDMIHELISVSQIRQKIIARQFAERFLRHLYTMIYELVVENEDRQKIAQVAGQWQEIDFTAWPETCDLSVSFALGYGEGEKEATKWLTLDKYLTADPDLKQLYPLPKRFNVIKRALEASGITDIQNYLLLPNQVQPPPPNPMMLAELDVKKADAEVKRANAQAAVAKLQLDTQAMHTKAVEGQTRINLETTKATGQLQLEQDKLAHKIAVDAAEITLQQQAQANDKLAAEAMPTRG